MKIECDKCAAKYSIADEKVRGKTFKIRCKKCSNVIIVRDKAAGAGALDVEAEAPASAGWHLAINGETMGPMPEDEVRQRFAAGEVDRETAIWQEGFEDWLPLGEVDTFADLAAGGAAAEDPFTSANQDEYAAASAQPVRASAAVAAPVARAAASGGSAGAGEPSSPRVTRLTGQRNENSVLFSLDSLQALATGGGNNAANSRAAQQRSGPKALATQAPSSEGSGLIDIRALGAMVGSDAGPAPMTVGPRPEDASLPSFGGASLGGLVSAPLMPQPHFAEHGVPATVGAPAPPQRSNAPIYVLMALLLLAVAGLGAFIVFRPTETVVVNSGTAAPVAKGEDDEDNDPDKSKAATKEKDDDGKDEAGKDEDGKDEDGKDEAGKDEAGKDEAGEAVADEAGEAEDLKADPTKPKPSGKPVAKPSGTPPKPSGTPVAKPTTPSKPAPASDSLDVDCILDPKLAKCKGGGSSKPSKPAGPVAPTDPSLPETLGTTEIKAGVGPVKDAAKACGSKHGAAPGESVKVKLSIAGATGAVTSAAAEPPHNGTPLGNCVAAALKKATFKKFRKATLGAVYPVKM